MTTQQGHNKQQLHLILASSSRYRQAQLETLGLPFEAIAPDLDETPFPHETPLGLARRLALAKAQAIARLHPRGVIIGADQVLDLDGTPLGKPLAHDAARQQLSKLSGRTVRFHSAVAVVSANARQLTVTTCLARFCKLNLFQIENYLTKERPYDTAGSAKAEGLGVALLEELSSSDPSAIIGLPLIALTRMLRRIAIDPLAYTSLRANTP